MSALSQFQYRLRAAYRAFTRPPGVKFQAAYPLSSMGYLSGGDLTSGAAAAWSKHGAAIAVLINHAVYACVTKRAETVVGTPYRVVDKATRRPVNPRQDPIMKALATYQRYYGTSFFQDWMYNRDITGEVYIEPLGGSAGTPEGLDILSSLNVTPWSADGERIDYFQYQYGTRTLNMPVDSLIYDRNGIALMTPIHGYSPILVALGANDLAIIQAAGKAVMAYFNNDGVPATLVNPPQGTTWTAERTADIRRAFQPIKHASGKYATAVMPEPVNITTVEQPDLRRWAELLQAIEPHIYTAFRVPRSIAGDSDTSRFQSGPQDRLNYDAMIVSTLEDIAQVINAKVAPLFYGDDPAVEFEFETAQYEHIDQDERLAANEAWNNGTITLNEYREWIGLEALSDDAGKQYKHQLTGAPDNGKADIHAAYISGAITVNEYRAALGQPPLTGLDVIMIPASVMPATLAEIAAGGIPKPAPADPFGLTVDAEPPRQEPPQLPASTERSAQDELSTWRKYTHKHGPVKARTFETYVIPEPVANAIKTALVDDLDKDGITAAFDDAKAQLDGVTVDEAVLVELASVWADLDIADDLLGGDA